MKKYMVVGVGAFIFVVVVGFAYWVLNARTSDAPSETNATAGTTTDIVADGIIIKDKPGFKKGGWYFEYIKSGSVETIPIMFSSISMCSWKEASGRCKPSAFVNGRKAHIEGIDLSGSIGVVHLTFTEAPDSVAESP